MKARKGTKAAAAALGAYLLTSAAAVTAGCDLDQAGSPYTQATRALPIVLDSLMSMDVEKDLDFGWPPE